MAGFLKTIFRHRKKFALALVCLVMVFTNVRVLAISEEDLKSLYAPYYELDSECSASGGGSSTLSGTDNISKIFNYLVGKGLADFQAAGVLGNMWAESGFEPQRAQGILDRTVPADNWSEAKGGGYGLVQWTPGSKMVDPVKAAGKDPNLLEVQLDFLWEQLNGGTPAPEKKAGDHLKATTNVADATVSFETKYERHAGSPQPERIIKAQEILDQAKAGGISSAPSTGGGGATGAVSKVYMLGDSITRGGAARYREKFGAKQVSVDLSAQDSRSWNGGGLTADGTPGPGKEAIKIDEAMVKSSQAVVIALGTNGLEASNPIDEVAAEVKRINPSAKMYWINVAGPRVPGDIATFNNSLQQKAGANYSIIDWAKSVDPSSNGKNDPNALLADGIHPNQNGYETLSNLVVDTVVNGGAGASSSEPACVCTSEQGKPVIALDPGHGGSTIDRDDPETGLHDGDYKNDPEVYQVFDVAQSVKTILENSGYRVVLTKDTADQSKFLRERANVANNANAAIGVSIHTQGDRRFGEWQEIYTQKVGLYRGAGTEKQTFDNEQVASKSQDYAKAMKEARDATEVKSGTTEIKDNSFDGRDKIEPGNIPLVALWSKVPWIYLEAGGIGSNPNGGLGDPEKFVYAAAIAEGIKKAVPTTTAQGAGCGPSAGNTEGLSNTILSYAWPDYKGRGFTENKPEYQAAVDKAIGEGKYVGGLSMPGVDCGGFVTLLMNNSGYEPEYNYGGKGGPTPTQKQWLDENWVKVGGDGKVESTTELKQGDVAMQPGHTFMFAGTIDGFNSHIASASLENRAPMAGKESINGSGVEWYRKK